MELLSYIVVWSSAVPAVLSVAVYAFAPWYQSSIGRHFFSYMLVLGAILALSAISTVLAPDSRMDRFQALPEWFVITWFVFYLLLPLVLWWRLWIVIREFRAERRRRKAERMTDGGGSSGNFQ